MAIFNVCLFVDDNSAREFQCLSVSSEGFHCSWSHPEPPEEYYISGYQLSYRLADGFDYYPGYGTELSRISLSPTATEYDINGLMPYVGIVIEIQCVMSPDLGSGDWAMPDDPMDNITSISSVFNITQPEGTCMCVYILHGAMSNIIFFCVNLVADGNVEDFEVDVVSPTSVDVSLRPPSRVDWNGRIESYGIIVERGQPNTGDARKRRQMASNVETIMVLPQANHGDPSLASEPLKLETYRVQELEENFKYTIAVVIINSKGAGTSSDPILQTMPEAGMYY